MALHRSRSICMTNCTLAMPWMTAITAKGGFSFTAPRPVSIDPNGPGYCPYVGRENVGDGANLVLHPIDSVALHKMFEWYATGGYSDADIAEALNSYEYALPSGEIDQRGIDMSRWRCCWPSRCLARKRCALGRTFRGHSNRWRESHSPIRRRCLPPVPPR